MHRSKPLLIVLILVNAIVLLGQLWPAGAASPLASMDQPASQ